MSASRSRSVRSADACWPSTAPSKQGSEGPCDRATAIAYIAEPAPSKRGVIPRLGGLRALTAAAGVETGRVDELLEALAQRIVARLRAGGQ